MSQTALGWLEDGEMNITLVPVSDTSDILPRYRGTAVGDLLAYHNLGAPHRRHVEAELLIGMCMDHRLQLRIPSNFAYTLRCAGANLGMLEFDVSFAIALGCVRTVCLIGHDGCRMVDVASKRAAFVSGLVENAGWDRRSAEEHFDEHASRYEIGESVEFMHFEARRVRATYSDIIVAPLSYSTCDGKLYQILEGDRNSETQRQNELSQM